MIITSLPLKKARNHPAFTRPHGRHLHPAVHSNGSEVLGLCDQISGWKFPLNIFEGNRDAIAQRTRWLFATFLLRWNVKISRQKKKKPSKINKGAHPQCHTGQELTGVMGYQSCAQLAGAGMVNPARRIFDTPTGLSHTMNQSKVPIFFVFGNEKTEASSSSNKKWYYQNNVPAIQAPMVHT